MEEILSDVIARLQKLEQTPSAKSESTASGGETRHYFKTPKEIVNRSITATDSAWSDSTSGNYIPNDAKEAIVFAYVTGTSDAVGLNKVEARGGGVTLKILAAQEEGSASAPGGQGYSRVPLSGGRFDILATIAGGRTSGSFSFVIELVGYVT